MNGLKDVISNHGRFLETGSQTIFGKLNIDIEC